MTEKSEELINQKIRVDFEKAISHLNELKNRECIFFSFDSLEDTGLIFIVEDPADPDLKIPFRARVSDFLKRQMEKMNLTNTRYSVIFFNSAALKKNLEMLLEIIILVLAVKSGGSFLIFTGEKELFEESLQKYYSKSENRGFILGRSRIIVFPDLLETLKQKDYKKLLKEFLLQVS